MIYFSFHQVHPSTTVPYAHMRLLRALVGALTGTIIATPRLTDVDLDGADGEQGGDWVNLLSNAPNDDLVRALQAAAAGGVAVPPDSLAASATPYERAMAVDAYARGELRKVSASLLVRCRRGRMCWGR